MRRCAQFALYSSKYLLHVHNLVFNRIIKALPLYIRIPLHYVSINTNNT